MGATELINAVASRLSLIDYYRPRGASHPDVDDDYIILHTRSCYLGVNNRGKWVYHTRTFPHDHVEYNYAAPYETSQQAWDHLLNHNDVLAKEN
jgi:hypothetical protein